jgi:ATP-dependent Clp protease ATP-binding subunit ClpA
MFERFTKQAKEIVVDATRQAEAADAAEIGAEHVATALLLARDTPTAALLADLGLSGDALADDVYDACRAAERRGGLSETDAGALRKLGFDVDTFVANVEWSFGANAMAGRPRRRRRFGLGHRPFTPEAKKVLEGALRQARELGRRELTDVHLLLALLVAGGVVAEVLAERGVDYPRVRALLRRAS